LLSLYKIRRDGLAMKQFPKFINEEMLRREIWEFHVIADRCKGCGYCIEFCPEQILEASKEYNAKGYHPPKVKDGLPPDACSGCGFCALICPEFAIFIRKKET